VRGGGDVVGQPGTSGGDRGSPDPKWEVRGERRKSTANRF